jgi:hypothetical protein
LPFRITEAFCIFSKDGGSEFKIIFNLFIP